jgi:hypothetical protein
LIKIVCMFIAEEIFVGRPDAIGLSADGEAIIDLNEALAEAASDASQITILGGYYDAGWLVKLLENLPRRRRGMCRLRLAFGSDAAVTLPRMWEDMRKVRARLRALGYRHVEISIVVHAPVHFHTKLFRFLRTTQPYWFIGSANPGSRRHELMVRLTGRHESLSNYVNAVFKVAQSVEGPVPASSRHATLRDFLLDGMLCHKPPHQQLFTFDAYRLSPEDRRRIDARLGEGSGVLHASPKTEGFGFGLRSAIAMTEDDREVGEDTLSRLRFRDSGVETLFGLWMPRAYVAEVEPRVAEQQLSNANRLTAIGKRLSSPSGQQAATDAFAAYIESMDRYLGELKIEAKPIRDREIAFTRFLLSQTRGLSDPAFVARQARVMTFAPMFDIWQDPAVAQDFVNSFFEDLVWRASATSARRPRIVKAILNALGGSPDFQTFEELEMAFARRLVDEKWSDKEWQVLAP